ncbi:hypothetical protein COBT_002824 [Conglomerata obtusa]
MNYTKELLQKNIRTSNRSFTALNPINLHTLSPNTFQVSSPSTSILISAQSTITAPHSDTPHQGIVKIYCNPHLRMEKMINASLKKIYIKSRCIDLDLLSIEYGVLCHNVIFELRILYSDGCPLRMCVEGLNYAIDNYELDCDDATVGKEGSNKNLKDEIYLNKIEEKLCKDNTNVFDTINKSKLNKAEGKQKVCVNYKPFALYFIYVVNKWLIEPTKDEEEEKEGECIIVIGNGNLVMFEKMGIGQNFFELQELIRIAKKCEHK